MKPNSTVAQDTLRLLVIEDNEIDREIVRRAFRKSGMPCEMAVAPDGGSAIDLMLGDDDHTPLEKPYIVLLDMDMPGVDGHEFLAEIRSDPQLRRTVIFVLTGALRESDTEHCYDQCVAGVLFKSAFSEDPESVVEMLTRYWQLVQLPHE